MKTLSSKFEVFRSILFNTTFLGFISWRWHHENSKISNSCFLHGYQVSGRLTFLTYGICLLVIAQSYGNCFIWLVFGLEFILSWFLDHSTILETQPNAQTGLGFAVCTGSHFETLTRCRHIEWLLATSLIVSCNNKLV